jgi:RNA polymerase sigma-70 factor (ECF subfamily)
LRTKDFKAKQLNWPEEYRALANQYFSGDKGHSGSIGEILNACRAYLTIVAHAELPQDLAGKVAPSDIVQETLMEAYQGFYGFRGKTREELLAWLRQILRNNLLNATRRFRETASRQVGLETPLARTSSSAEPGIELADAWPGPRSEFIQREEEQRLMEALARLPSVYRDVIELHNREHLTFAQVGERIGRSAEAARKLWARGIEMLRAEMRE